MAWSWPARWTRSPHPWQIVSSATRAARLLWRSRCSVRPCASSPIYGWPCAAVTSRHLLTASLYPFGRRVPCAKARRSPLAAAGLARGSTSLWRVGWPSPPSWAAAPHSCAGRSAASRGVPCKRATCLRPSPILFIPASAACDPPMSPPTPSPQSCASCPALTLLPSPMRAMTRSFRLLTPSPRSPTARATGLPVPPSPAPMPPTSSPKPRPWAASKSLLTGCRSC